MRSGKFLLSFCLACLSVSLPAASRQSEEIELVAPAEGETVPLLRPLQKEWMKMPREERIASMTDIDGWRRRMKEEPLGGNKPLPVRLAWRCRHKDGKACKGVYILEVMNRHTGRRFCFAENMATNAVEVWNLEAGETYTWCVWCGKEIRGGSFRTEDIAPRVLSWEGVGNVRDHGGWRTMDGARVRQGIAYRSAGLNGNAITCLTTEETLALHKAGQLEALFGDKGREIAQLIDSGKLEPNDERLRKTFKRDVFKKGKPCGTPQSREYVRNFFGIKTDLDLRQSGSECWGMTGSPLGDAVTWANIPSLCYHRMADPEGREAFAKCFRLFLDPANYGIVYHCIGGADRTGSLAFILNGLAGVSEEDLWRDWEFTVFGGQRRAFDHGHCLDGLLRVFNAYPGRTVNERIEAYVKDCGITDAEIARFRALVLDRGGKPVNLEGLPLWQSGDKVRNFRDLGGWKGLGGRRVKKGLVYRSAQFDDATDKTRKVLVGKLGIRSELDLRTPEVAAPLNGVSPLGKDVLYSNQSSQAYGGFEKKAGRENFAATFRWILNEAKYPLVFHCAKGADRTGSWAFFLNGLVGVSEEDLRFDWEVTSDFNSNPQFKHHGRYDALVALVMKRPGATFTDKIAAYAHECGITDEEIATWRERMLEPENGGDDAALKTPETSSLFVRHVDPLSGVVSYILKPGLVAHNQQSLYFVAKSMTDDGRFLVFWAAGDERDAATQDKKETYLLDFKTEKIVRLPEVRGKTPFIDTERDALYYINDKGVHRMDFLDGDPTVSKLVCALPPELDYAKVSRYCTHITLSHDRTKCFLDMELRCDRKNVHGVLDLATGKWTKWGETPFLCNHAQINPFDDAVALCAWEGAWQMAMWELPEQVRESERAKQKKPELSSSIPRPHDMVYPRVWIMRKEGKDEMIPPRIGNYATHEKWTEDGRGVYWCDRGVDLYDVSSGEQRLVVPLAAQHSTMSADLKYAVFDKSAGDWWRGCSWTCGFWNRDTHRGVFINSKMPVYMPKENESKQHPDPHPQFVCKDRYVISTMLSPYQMNLCITPVDQLARITSDPATAPSVKRIPLRWESGTQTRTPYEITIDPRVLRLSGMFAPPAGNPGDNLYTAFAVEAEVGGERRRVEVKAIAPGNEGGPFFLRFKVPDGAAALDLLADVPERFEPVDAASCDNIFRKALSARRGDWKANGGMGISSRHDGLLFKGEGTASLTADVPQNCAGASVKFEMDLRNRSDGKSPCKVRLVAVGMSGEDIAEPVMLSSSTRKASQTSFLRLRGTMPANAEKVRVEIECSDGDADFLVSHIALRPAEDMRFDPKSVSLKISRRNKK